MSDDLKAVKWTISGRVQGVGYRYFAEAVARTLKIVGTVRNLHTGEVEVYAEGPEEALLRFKERLKEGPPLGRVSEITGEPHTPSGKHKAFRVTY